MIRFRSLMVLCACARCLCVPTESHAEPLPYYGELLVLATGVREAAPTAPPSELEAEVYINGVPVGRTPYSDGLPTGKYEVAVRYKDAAPYQSILTVVSGRTHRVDARLTLPMTLEERAEQAKMREIERRKQQEEAYAAYQEASEAWDAKWLPVVPKRKRNRVMGSVFLAVGLAALIPGTALVVSASKDDDVVQDWYSAWLRSLDTESQEQYAALIEDKQSTRNTKNVSGIALLAAGGAMAVVGTVLLPLAPKIPERPEPNGYMLSSARISPWASPEAGGLSLHLRF